MTQAPIEDLLRPLAPQVLGALVRRFGQFEACEDAVQEAMLAAITQWPADGTPDNPYGWLMTVAVRRFTDWVRSDAARRRREGEDLLATPPSFLVAAGADQAPAGDDTLKLLFLCCHASLSPASQIALTLRAVGGLSSAEIAHAFFVPEATMAQRISRAKASIRKAGAVFAMPPAAERAARLEAVLGVLYLIFNEGYVATSGLQLQRRDLTAEAIRLTRLLHALLPDEAEVAGLLALMLLTDARRDARVGADGSLVALADQDRSRWNATLIAEGSALIAATLGSTRELGAYQLQAAIAAVHAEAGEVAETDWPQILALYDLLERVAPNPMVTLNRGVAVAMVHGPKSGLELVSALEGDERMARHHRLHAVRAHLLELDGRMAEARESYRLAARYALSLPEKRYLERRAAVAG